VCKLLPVISPDYYVTDSQIIRQLLTIHIMYTNMLFYYIITCQKLYTRQLCYIYTFVEHIMLSHT